MEDFNNWVMTIAGYITVIEYTAKFLLKWLLPKIRESLKKWRKRNANDNRQTLKLAGRDKLPPWLSFYHSEKYVDKYYFPDSVRGIRPFREHKR